MGHDIEEYRRLTGPKKYLKELLLAPPYFADKMIAIMDEIDAERKKDLSRQVDLEIGE